MLQPPKIGYSNNKTVLPQGGVWDNRGTGEALTPQTGCSVCLWDPLVVCFLKNHSKSLIITWSSAGFYKSVNIKNWAFLMFPPQNRCASADVKVIYASKHRTHTEHTHDTHTTHTHGGGGVTRPCARARQAKRVLTQGRTGASRGVQGQIA